MWACYRSLISKCHLNGILLAGQLWPALLAGFKVLLGSGVSGTDPHFESFWIRTPYWYFNDAVGAVPFSVLGLPFVSPSGFSLF